MGAIREKMVVKWRMQGEVLSHSLTKASVRDVSTQIDEPLQRDGTNQGLTPTETLVAALIGCTNVISHKIARKIGVELKNMHIVADVDFDRRGVTLSEDVAVPFPAITLTIDVRTSASAEQMDQLRTELAMFCPLAKVIRASGTVLTENWNITAV
ncbi:MAG: OsmC family protein [Rubrivivax sp.]